MSGAIRIRDPGGPYVEGFTTAFYAPFTAATGIEIDRMVGGVEPTGMIREMVRSGTYTWDMVVVSDAAHRQLAAEGCLAPIEVETPDTLTIPAALRSPWFVGNATLAMVLAVNTETYGATGGPSGWADFWDVAAWPGRRSLRRHPIDTLEQALLADGVAAGSLYPLDVDRAFRALDRIRPAVQAWWPRAVQTTEMMRDDTVDLVPTSSIRAQAAIDAGAAFRVEWGGNLRSVEGWCILAGSPRAELCRRFIAFAATAERQAAFTPFVCASPSIPGALALIPPGRARLLPDYHRGQGVVADSVYWSVEKDGLEARFEGWLSSLQRS